MKQIVLLLTLTSNLVWSQTSVPPLEANANLNARFSHFKTTSQTFQDYKVIKEVKLDEFWHMVTDSLKKQKAEIIKSSEVVTQLTTQLQRTSVTVKTIQASMTDIVYDSQHISFFGIHFKKWVFSTLVLASVGALVFLIALLIGRARLMTSAMTEKSETLNSITEEFEQYRRKALEKEKKLSRELQTERNKLLDLKRI